MSKISLARTKSGVPSRLIVYCDYTENSKAKLAGRGVGSYRVTSKSWSYPVDPQIFHSILTQLPDIEIPIEVAEYFKGLYDKQQRVRKATTNFAPLDTTDKLWSFQRASIRFIEEIGRGILAHEMGTGKTVIGAYALKYFDSSKVLIICPDAVKWSWSDHLKAWTDKRPTIMWSKKVSKRIRNLLIDEADIIDGNKAVDRDYQILNLLKTADSFVLLLNYDQARIHRKVLESLEYDFLIVDEAHRINNRKTQRAETVVSLAKNSYRVALLSGTVFRKSYADFFNLLHICDPVRFPSYWNFIKFYMETIDSPYGGSEIVCLTDPEAFNAMLSQYMYHKSKKEALPDLPDIIIQPLKLPLNQRQATAYERMEQEFLIEIKRHLDDGQELDSILRAPTVLARLTRLRQICLTPAILGGVADSAKLDAIRELLEEDYKDTDEKILFFSMFRAFLPYIEVIFESLNIPYGKIVGGMKLEERREVEQALNSGAIRGVLGTIDAMGEGLNLQAAKTVVLCDKSWLDVVNQQAISRVHRGTITEAPRVIELYHPGTVEEDVRASCRKRARLHDETVGQVETVRQLLIRKGIGLV